MQDHWGKIHDDMRNIYEDIKSSESSDDSKTGSGTMDSDSKVRVRQAIYDIRLKAKKEGKPLSKVYQEYIGRSSMSPGEKSLVKAKVMGASEEFIYHFDTIEFDEQSGNYKVKVTESATGKIFQRRMSLQKINELRHHSDSFVIEKKKDSTYLEPDMKKRQANNEKARKEMEKVPGQKNPHFEEKEDYDPMKVKEALDPVGKEDGDVDNDGDKDKSDKYLMKRRKAIGKAIAAKEEVESPFGDIKSMVKRAMKRVDADVDGDVDDKDRKSSDEMGEYVPTPDGKKKTTRVKEGYSWRDDLIEVMGDSIDDDTKKKIDVMKGKNKITVHGLNKEETSHEEPVEEVALQEDQSEKKYCKLCKKEETKSECTFGPAMWEKYSVDLAEDNGVEVDEAMMAGPRKDAMKKKEYSAKSGSDRATAFNIGTRRDVSVGDPKIKSRGGRVDKRTGEGDRGMGNAAKRRMGEEAEQPDKQMLAKKKQLMMKQQMLDKQRLQAQQQGKLPSGHRVEQNESMSAFNKVKADLEKKYGKGSIISTSKKKVDHAKANAAKANVRKPTKREQESSGRYTGGYAGD